SLNGTWTYTDLLSAVPGAGAVSGELLQWVDRHEQRTYVAMRSLTGLVLFREDEPGSWSTRNLTLELDQAQMVSADLSLFTDLQGRVRIAGTNSVGDVIVYQQLIQRNSDGQWRWQYRNLSHND